MATAISRRQQARNERNLQDLIRTIPSNSSCADCSTKNPGWASWNLGVFLCMRCAALHRKLGTHVSKIKSLSMDSWNAEQVDNMKKIGNAVSNRQYNPSNTKPTIPVDIDEVETAMEKFIRQKYEQRAFASGAVRPAMRQSTGSTSTGSLGGEREQPPPLPPKPGKRFGFSLRSSSSTFPRPQQDRYTPPLSPAFSGNSEDNVPASPVLANKPAKVFGAVISGTDNNFNVKLASLREMGFKDGRRNSEVLKSMNGNVDRTVESLVRLGEGSKPVSRAVTPVSMGGGNINGLTIERTRQPEARKPNSNPWEVREAAPQQQRAATQPLPRQASDGVLRQQAATPSNSSWNPFMQQAPQVQPTDHLENSFQNLQVAQEETQSLGDRNQMPAQWQNNLVQPTIANQPAGNPWAQSFHQAPAVQHHQSQPQQIERQPNPFLRTSRSQTFTSSNPWATHQLAQPQAQLQQTNPFGNPWQQQMAFQQPATQSPVPIYGQQADFFSTPALVHPQAPQVQQPQPQQQFAVQEQAQQHDDFPSNGQQNPWQQQQPPQETQQDFSQQFQQPQQPAFQQAQLPASQPIRHDKSSILALYNYPQLAPRRHLQTLHEDGVTMSAPSSPPKSRSVTMPVSVMESADLQGVGNNNPFASGQGSAVTSIGASRHVSRESMDFVGMNGRHSPDAFAGLSSRFVR